MAQLNSPQPTHGARKPAGTAAIETAVVLPFLMLLALGTTDLGRFLHAQIAVTTAARNGAQYGSSSINASLDSAGIRDRALAELSGVPGMSQSPPDVSSARYDEAPGHVSIRVSVSYNFTTLVKYPGLPQSLRLIRSVHMRVLPIEVGDDEDTEGDSDES